MAKLAALRASTATARTTDHRRYGAQARSSEQVMSRSLTSASKSPSVNSPKQGLAPGWRSLAGHEALGEDHRRHRRHVRAIAAPGDEVPGARARASRPDRGRRRARTCRPYRCRAPTGAALRRASAAASAPRSRTSAGARQATTPPTGRDGTAPTSRPAVKRAVESSRVVLW